MRGITFLACLVLALVFLLGLSLSNSEVLKPYTGSELGRQLALQNDQLSHQARIEADYQARLNAEKLRAAQQANRNAEQLQLGRGRNEILLGEVAIYASAMCAVIAAFGLAVVAIHKLTLGNRLRLQRERASTELAVQQVRATQLKAIESHERAMMKLKQEDSDAQHAQRLAQMRAEQAALGGRVMIDPETSEVLELVTVPETRL